VKNRHDKRGVCRALQHRLAAVKGFVRLTTRILSLSDAVTFAVTFTCLRQEIAFELPQEFTG
jgi:hypothetical protein